MPWSQKKLQQHLTTQKNKTNDSVRTGVRLSEIKRAAEEQCLQPSFDGLKTTIWLKVFCENYVSPDGPVAEWLAYWIQVQKGPGSNSSPLEGAGVTAGLAESNGSLPPGL